MLLESLNIPLMLRQTVCYGILPAVIYDEVDNTQVLHTPIDNIAAQALKYEKRQK